jgi:hypothetical protein
MDFKASEKTVKFTDFRVEYKPIQYFCMAKFHYFCEVSDSHGGE